MSVVIQPVYYFGSSLMPAIARLDKFPAFDPNWDEKIQAKWFEGYEKLMALEQS